MHAEMRIGNSMLLPAEATSDYAPTSIAIHLHVPNCDAVYQQALGAGGITISKCRDTPYGGRHGGIKDPCGNIWWVATHIADLPADE